MPTLPQNYQQRVGAVLVSDAGDQVGYSGSPLITSDAATDSLGNLKTVDYLHHKIHAGTLFSVTGADELAAAASTDILIQTNGTPIHLLTTGGFELETNFYIYEATTFSAAGAAITPINFNRTSATTLDATITKNPTVTLVGTLLYSEVVHASQQVAGHNLLDREFLMKASTVYMVRYTSVVNNNQVSYQLSMYESTI